MTASTPSFCYLAAAVAVALGAGCLRVPESTAPMCRATSDCDVANLEVCEEGVCWGNPPPGPFAAVVSPPSKRRDLVSREVSLVPIPGTGLMEDFVLETPVQLTGRVVAFCAPPMIGCDTTPIGATITVSRRSQFRGGPGFKTSVSVPAGTDSFSIPVPRTGDGDEAYTVTIVPDRGATITGSGIPGSDRSAADLVPPMRQTLPVGSLNLSRGFTLGGPDLSLITGAITSATAGLAGYRVVALGRWDASEPLAEVSSVGITDENGKFELRLSDGLMGGVELVARPPDKSIAATVHFTNVDATVPQAIVVPATLGKSTTLTVVVNGAGRDGTVSPVAGAVVSVSGSTPDGAFTISDQKVTNDRGTVDLSLLDGPAIVDSYRLSIIPPASAEVGVVFDQKVALVDMPPVRLPPRIALRGQIVDSTLKPLNNVTVTARPALRFLWTLDAAPQAFVAAIPASSSVTFDAGNFLLWIDATVAQTWGTYELMIEPPADVQAPTFLKTGVEIPRVGTSSAFEIDTIVVPDTSFVHGRIVTADGSPVDNAELKLYTVSTATGLCSEVAHAPTSCPIPAPLLGRNTSDAAGTVRLALPR